MIPEAEEVHVCFQIAHARPPQMIRLENNYSSANFRGDSKEKAEMLVGKFDLKP